MRPATNHVMDATLDELSLRRLPIGAEWRRGRGVDFRVWAPHGRRIEVVFDRSTIRLPDLELRPESGGYFGGLAEEARPGVRYWLRLSGSDRLLADPGSRFQPEGPDGPSEIIDSTAFSWSDAEWPGVDLPGRVLYEMHIGTFTPEGTYRAAEQYLPELASLGITTISMMPVADFRGQFGWGYDGVNLFAPTRLYGRPDDLRHFIDRAHACGLGVILDVVYNHFGAGGEFLKEFSPHYFTDRYRNEWGEALNFDGQDSEGVRQYIVANAGYWIEEFHFDGLRLDATQQIFDASPRHILAEVTRRVRQAAAGRATLIVGENEPQNTGILWKAEQGGCEIDTLWNDDFHHAAMVALTNRNEAYYTDYRGSPQEFVSAAKWGYLYQGQRYKWQQKRRGTPAFELSPPAFVNYLQNHDQVANSGRGLRLHQLTSPGRLRAMTTVWLLMPQTPMFFQGQEFAASSPFFYFADRPADAQTIASGRGKFLAQFRTLATTDMQARLRNPTARETFEQSRLNHAQRHAHAEIYALHRDLLDLRRHDPAFSRQQRRGLDGAVLGPQAFVLRFFCDDGDRLLIANFGLDLHLDPAPEPLLAPPLDCQWQLIWSSEDYRYGGNTTPPVESDENWRIPGETTVVLKARPQE